jgi:hypothetical protein
MRRFVTFVFLLFFTIPFGISISGCGKKSAIVFCNGGDSGIVVGQTTSITLLPRVYGVSLDFGQFGQISSPTATDCKGGATPVSSYTYGTTDMTLADVVPNTGRLCAGTWNRNTGGGIPDYTTCMATNKTGTAYVTASANGATSNPLPVFVHPVVTSVVLGAPTPTANCSTDPDASSNCCPLAAQATVTAQPYPTNSCLSQGATGQLVARVYQNATTLPKDNITCQVGHLAYAAQTGGVVSIDENGVATAQAPGSTIITATVANAGSSAGFFSTCPPAKITLSVPGSTSTNVTVNQNFTQAITATATDIFGVTLTGLNLQYISTTSTTIPSGGAGSVTPIFAGTASVTAICEPPTCNPSPLNEVGLFGNGTPVTSNPLQVTSPGTNSTILYAASTKSLYLSAIDFTTNIVGNPVRLQYVPNSMVISNDGTTIYLGSATELMVYNAAAAGLTREDVTLPGSVLAVSPDNTTIVVSDPVRQVISLASVAGGVQTTFGGVGTHAQFSADGETVYITSGSQLLVHSAFTGWTNISLATPATDVAVSVPSVGAFLAGLTTTARGYCPKTTVGTTSAPSTTSNVYYPDAGVAGPATDRLAVTNDGIHIIGATVTPAPTINDLRITNSPTGLPTGACPASGLQFMATPVATSVLPGVVASSINGVFPASDSSVAFITYTGSGGVLPLYTPAATGQGTLASVKLSGAAVAPVSGVFSADNATFFTGTSGDNLVHLVTKGATGFMDSSTIAPKLPDVNGNQTTPDLLVQRPRKTI